MNREGGVISQICAKENHNIYEFDLCNNLGTGMERASSITNLWKKNYNEYDFAHCMYLVLRW